VQRGHASCIAVSAVQLPMGCWKGLAPEEAGGWGLVGAVDLRAGVADGTVACPSDCQKGLVPGEAGQWLPWQ